MDHSPVKKGLFISCEGGEGVGKTAFIKQLSQQLRLHLQIEPILTREPGGTKIGEKIREVFNHPPSDEILSTESEFFLLSAARSQHVQCKIQPALKLGCWVICDRFYDSSYVYQGHVKGLAFDFMEPIIKASCHGLHPDLTFLLDCPVDVSLERIQYREVAQNKNYRATRFDKEHRDFHERIRQAYLDVAQKSPQRFHILNTQKSDSKALAAESIKLFKDKGWL